MFDCKPNHATAVIMFVDVFILLLLLLSFCKHLLFNQENITNLYFHVVIVERQNPTVRNSKPNQMNRPKWI